MKQHRLLYHLGLALHLLPLAEAVEFEITANAVDSTLNELTVSPSEDDPVGIVLFEPNGLTIPGRLEFKIPNGVLFAPVTFPAGWLWQTSTIATPQGSARLVTIHLAGTDPENDFEFHSFDGPLKFTFRLTDETQASIQIPLTLRARIFDPETGFTSGTWTGSGPGTVTGGPPATPPCEHAINELIVSPTTGDPAKTRVREPNGPEIADRIEFRLPEGIQFTPLTVSAGWVWQASPITTSDGPKQLIIYYFAGFDSQDPAESYSFEIPWKLTYRLTAENPTKIPLTVTLRASTDDANSATWTTTETATVTSAITSYDRWISSHYPGETNPDVIGMTADPNQDGLVNLLAFLFDASPKTFEPEKLQQVSASFSKFQQVSGNNTNLTLTFRFNDAAHCLTSFVEFGNDLAGWTKAIHGQNGITIVRDDDHFGAGIDRVTATIPHQNANNFFTRLGFESD